MVIGGLFLLLFARIRWFENIFKVIKMFVTTIMKNVNLVRGRLKQKVSTRSAF